jgi:hypothetical protein
MVLNLNTAKMVLKTIDANEHEPWLRDTDPTNPQAIFRRIHLKFRGTDTIAVSSQRGDLSDFQNFVTRSELVTFFWSYKTKPDNPIRVITVLGYLVTGVPGYRGTRSRVLLWYTGVLLEHI